ncbi:MAG TPA: alpha-L-arabinofuranosidase C-terminal domain-containing protein [Pyrinomonadaceae bacterium]|nr:alpha-L-arabinofuranosidase C-terminal domain-containing protein [Pyrinomonadaceae bacterium]
MRPRLTRLVTILAIVCLWLSGQHIVLAQQTVARIKVDTDRTIGEVDPLLFGNFSEHLGRMIYGGIYEEGSPLSDANGYRMDVMEAVKQLNVSILRWPGGNFASGYNWTDGIGPKDQRPVRIDLAWNDLESNRFGTDEFLRYCELLKTEPYICINAGLGSVDDARHWVEYCNESRHTYWADQRRKNGREEPYKVKYWALGNEIDGPWQLGNKSAEEYSKFALETAKAMRLVDRSIKLVASGSSNYGADWIAWNRIVLQTLRNQVDYIAIHTYINNRDNDLERFLAWSQTIDNYIEVTAALIRQAQSGQANPRPIYVAYDEWNVWYRTGNREKLEEIYNFEDALAMGVFFNSFFRHANVVKMANLAQMVNVIAPIMTNKQGLFLQPTYFPIVEYGKQRGNQALDVWVSAPTYQLQNRPPLRYLDVSASYSAKDGLLYLNVLNRSKDKDLATRIENQQGKLEGEVGVWQMNNADLKATHTFGDDKKVRPATSSFAATVQNNSFSYTFPAHSLTILKLRVK